MKEKYHIPLPCYRVPTLKNSELLIDFFSLFPKDYSLIIEGGAAGDVFEALSRIADNYSESEYVLYNNAPGMRFEFYLGNQRALDLADIIYSHAEPEYCDHAFVLAADSTLLSWHDFPFDPIYVRLDVDKKIVERLAERCSSHYVIVS